MRLVYAKTAPRDAMRRGRRAAARVGYERPGFAFLLNGPALVALVILAGYPIVSSAWISLHKYSLKRPRVFEFVGLGNFELLLGSDEFWLEGDRAESSTDSRHFGPVRLEHLRAKVLLVYWPTERRRRVH